MTLPPGLHDAGRCGTTFLLFVSFKAPQWRTAEGLSFSLLILLPTWGKARCVKHLFTRAPRPRFRFVTTRLAIPASNLDMLATVPAIMPELNHGQTGLNLSPETAANLAGEAGNGGEQRAPCPWSARTWRCLQARRSFFQSLQSDGVVRMLVLVRKDGAMKDMELISGDPTLAAAAMDAVRKWRYQPTLLNGQLVEVETEVDVNYTLK